MSSRTLLELQSDRIEALLAAHRTPARVTGGGVTPRAIQYHLAPALGTKVSKVQALAEELALALGVSSVRVARQGNGLQLEIPRDDARPVKLLSLMAQLMTGPRATPESQTPGSQTPGDCAPRRRTASWGHPTSRIPAGTAVLGLCDDGAPLLLRLPSPDVVHVLIAGCTGAGKTALCQTIILSLAMTHRRSQLQFLLLGEFGELEKLPHVMEYKSLAEITRLIPRPSPEPRIVIVMDEFLDEIEADQDRALLTFILEQGRGSGIHIVAAVRAPNQVAGLGFPVRLVGKVVSPEEARVAAGIGGTGAEKLTGRGDFIAVAVSQVLRFQAAYVSPAEVEQIVAQFGSAPRRWDLKGRPSLLRQTCNLLAGSS
jgi:S-DNA-T family DNA segregation ATPase FtsK/SpoIIIE